MYPKFRSFTLSASISAITLATLSTSAFAGTPRFLDARAFAMGGVGVASARPAAASFYNPALLALEHKEKANDFGMLLPSVMVQASDENELFDKVDDFEDDFLKPFEDAISVVENTTFGSAAEARAVGQDFVNKAEALQNELLDIDEDGIIADVGAGISFIIPSKDFAVGVFASGAARLASRLNYEDDVLLQSYIDDVNTIIDPLNPNVITDLQNLALGYDPNTSLESDVRVIGAGQTQAGISFASSFELWGQDIAIGVSPKVVDQIVYDYTAKVDDFEFSDVDDGEVKKSSFNLDLGVATYLDRDRRWLTGLSVLNVIGEEIETKPFAFGVTPDAPVKIELEPTVLAGISYAGDSYILAADVELTEKKALFNEDDTQFIGLGAEYDLFETVQFRVGARHNLAGSGDPYFTTGFGFTILGASLELAALSSSDANTLGASLQLGATF